MKALFFSLLIAQSFVLEIIMVNMSKDISLKTPQAISIFLLCLSLVATSCTLIVWIIKPCQHSVKVTIVTLSLNVSIKLICTVIFSIFYYNLNYMSSEYLVFSFLTLIASFILLLLFDGNTNNNQSTIVPYHLQEGVIQEEDKPDIKITVFTSDEPSSCTICLEDFIQDENINETNCGHFFHENCMEKILNNNIKKCPVCRRNLYERNDVVI